MRILSIVTTDDSQIPSTKCAVLKWTTWAISAPGKEIMVMTKDSPACCSN